MGNPPDLEHLARQICEAEGHDPDELVTVGPLEQLTEEERLAQHNDTAGYAFVRVPRWTTYRSHAEKMAREKPG